MAAVNPATIKHLLQDADILGKLLDEVPIGVAVMDPAGKLLMVNKSYESITGLEGRRAIGLKCLHVLRCDHCTQGCPVMSGWGKSPSHKADGNIINRNREKVFVRLSVGLILDDDESVLGLVETLTLGSPHILDQSSGTVFGFGELVGRSPQVRKIFAMTPAIAQTDSPVLITGETGTGKDMLAEEIHNQSDRHDGPFVKINCGALPGTLLESEFFGHVKNALPGADHDKPGRLRMAHGGTLFISEVGDLPFELQTKLLAYMDDHVVHPVGSAKGVRTDVRIMAATQHDLERMVRKKRFRQDLLYRLNVIRLHLPPLRDRGADVSLLKDHFLRMSQIRFGKTLDGFTKNADKLLDSYSFPGNVRELRNIIEYAVNFCDGKVIRMRHLPGYILQDAGLPEDIAQAPAAPANDSNGSRATTPERWEDVQRQMIIDALVKSGGKKKQAADLLGWGRSTLWRKMKHFDIE